ncbi:MAG: Asp-tRNA(Asn)/Glu-tRNA(Gln) amidotransferase subunit GatC [Puniceicoccales bacterium]|jgi:aspartyl-tRNA(Asn)/glutamyl-tRNA(Gln) amidotransferase subunit C|nr:Asp-tRNA(Asn)/Glu-tRNA(Gln) amidotransferase subunit GatC [Puniceicoccales bacterium]
MDHIDLDSIAGLCRIDLADEERKTIAEQLDTMLTYMAQIKVVDVEGIEPMLHASAIHSILRDDQPGESFSTETALLNAPEQKNNQILVPRIVE